MNSKKFAEAQARFAQALTENPRFAEAHNYLGYSLQMEGTQNYPMALEHYSRAIQLKPNLAQAYEYRGRSSEVRIEKALPRKILRL